MVKIIDWPTLDPTILSLHQQGKSANYIAKQVSLQRETVAKRMENVLGLQTKKNGPRKSAEWVGEDSIRCSICREVKSKGDYYKRRADSAYYYSFCKVCVGDKERVRYLSKDVTWKKKCYDIKLSATRRSIDFGLTEEYLQHLDTVQQGLCAYTKIKLNLSTGRGLAHDCVSVDRFDTSLGYVVGNVLLCCARSNTIKHNQTPEELSIWMPTWYENGVATLRNIDAGWSTYNGSGQMADVA